MQILFPFFAICRKHLNGGGGVSWCNQCSGRGNVDEQPVSNPGNEASGDNFIVIYNL